MISSDHIFSRKTVELWHLKLSECSIKTLLTIPLVIFLYDDVTAQMLAVRAPQVFNGGMHQKIGANCHVGSRSTKQLVAPLSGRLQARPPRARLCADRWAKRAGLSQAALFATMANKPHAR